MVQDDSTGDDRAAPASAASPGLTWETPRQALGLFFRGATLRTGCGVALFVGTVLSLVNQGETIVNGDATAVAWLRVGVNYLVPFLVSSYGFLAARRRPVPS